MQEISQDILAVANAMRDNTVALAQPIKQGMQCTLQGQAQAQVQSEECLTQAGKLVILGVLSNATNGQTYLVLDGAELCHEWIKLQLQCYAEGHINVMYDWFIDRDFNL